MSFILKIRNLADLLFRHRKNNNSDLANIISGSVKCRRTNGHFGEDVGLGYPPAEDISPIRRLLVWILSGEEKDASTYKWLSTLIRWTNVLGIPPQKYVSTTWAQNIPHWNELRANSLGISCVWAPPGNRALGRPAASADVGECPHPSLYYSRGQRGPMPPWRQRGNRRTCSSLPALPGHSTHRATITGH